MQIGNYVEAPALVGRYAEASAPYVRLLRELADTARFPLDQNSGGDNNGDTSLLEARNFIVQMEKFMKETLKDTKYKSHFVEDGKFSQQELADIFALKITGYYALAYQARQLRHDERTALLWEQRLQICADFIKNLPPNIKRINIEADIRIKK
jgi:hypothetical protein